IAAASLATGGAAGDGEYLAILLQRHPRRNKRAAFFGSLDDYDAQAQPRQDPVASREVLSERLRSNGQLADQCAAAGDNALSQLAMFGRVDDVDAASQHGERLAVSVEGPLMRFAVDSSRQPADDGEALGRELETEPLRPSAPD